jgi:A/G-specific adenine glycosylase
MDTGALLTWYEAVKRQLPWRETTDPYAILVSEVMLQQTQAARVVPYYERWLAAFPTARALAGAEPATVLRHWSGLGYNRRALALQRAAAHVAAHGWPRDLQTLPGVGPYTAAAVNSFAFGVTVAAVDTNYRRVTARHGSHPDPPTPAVNQAMMELGATVCTARKPRCAVCPVESDCAAAAEGGPVIAPRVFDPAHPRVRFEDTPRYLRGRVVAALLAGDPLPDDAATVLPGLVDDGLVDYDHDGTPRLPRR